MNEFLNSQQIDAASKVLLCSTNQLRSLVHRIAKNLSKDERLTTTQWYTEKWYIEVVNVKKMKAASSLPKGQVAEAKIRAHLLGVTVNISKDVRISNSDGGNCYVRGKRWMEFVWNTFPISVRENEFHLYGKNYLAKRLLGCQSQ